MSGKWFILYVASVLLIASCAQLDPENAMGGAGIVPSPQATVYGRVFCGTAPIKDVVVSDGVATTSTDAQGVYNLPSAKKNGYVFVSLPSGYAAKGAISADAGFWRTLKAAPGVPERVDFELVQEDQSVHTMIAMGDIHIFDPYSLKAFQETFIPEINNYVNSVAGGPVYGLTLGDMTWDWYWYKNKYGIDQYLSAVSMISGMPVFNTVGNHDHDMQYDSKTEFMTKGEDWTCMKSYRLKQGPTCWSANIGGVHYVSIDDAITVDTGGTSDKDSRGYWRGITNADLEWLNQDLSYVSDDTPVVVSLHVPLFNRKGEANTSNINSVNHRVEDIVRPFQKFGKVLFISAHTHVLYNVTDYSGPGGLQVSEWNNGAVCGNFWGTCRNGINLCQDGTPGGYRVITVKDRKIGSVYKAIGKKDNYLFRAYDRNQICLDSLKLVGFTTNSLWKKNTNNWVYINVWDYKPSWKITVTEGGRELQWTKVDIFDPLYQLMYAEGLAQTNPIRKNTVFRVQASAPDTQLVITVEDDCGHSRTEIMDRPKAFDLETYINEESININK